MRGPALFGLALHDFGRRVIYRDVGMTDVARKKRTNFWTVDSLEQAHCHAEMKEFETAMILQDKSDELIVDFVYPLATSLQGERVTVQRQEFVDWNRHPSILPSFGPNEQAAKPNRCCIYWTARTPGWFGLRMILSDIPNRTV